MAMAQNFNYSITGTSVPTLVLSKVPKGARFFLERGRKVSMESASAKGSNWKHSVVGLEEIRNAGNSLNRNLGFGSKFLLSLDSTAKSRQLGESPTYSMVESLTDNAKISIDSHTVGQILALPAKKTLPMLIRKGGFLAAEGGVIIEKHTISGADSRFLSNILGMSYMQKLYGKGLYWLEIQGDIADAIYLDPGETIILDPMKLIAMNESIRLIDTPSTSSDKKVRDAKGRDFDILLQADVRGGWLYTSSIPQQNHMAVDVTKPVTPT